MIAVVVEVIVTVAAIRAVRERVVVAEGIMVKVEVAKIVHEAFSKDD